MRQATQLQDVKVWTATKQHFTLSSSKSEFTFWTTKLKQRQKKKGNQWQKSEPKFLSKPVKSTSSNEKDFS